MRHDRIVGPTSWLAIGIGVVLASAAVGQQPSGKGKSDQPKAKAETRPGPPRAPAGVKALRDLDSLTTKDLPKS